MGFFERIGNILEKTLKIFCPPLHTAMVSEYDQKRGLKRFLGFIGGFLMGQVYYSYLRKAITFPGYTGVILALVVSILMGVGNATSIQIRCISLLTLPMYCGKAGRGVLKALVFTYVIAGPIANMGINAREVVRVFACSGELAYNMSRARYALLAEPFRKAIFGINTEVDEVKDTLRSIRDVAAPIEAEIEGTDEIPLTKEDNDYIDKLLGETDRSEDIERKYKPEVKDEEEDMYEKQYAKKMEYRCEDQLSRGTAICMEKFASAHDACNKAMPWYARWLLCWPMKLTFVCNVMHVIGGRKMCDSQNQIDPGLGEGYKYLKKAESGLSEDLKDVNIQYKVPKVHDLVDVQDAKETGQRVIHAFEEKSAIMQTAISMVNVCMALLMLRIALAAQDYHDRFLINIEYDNLYITDYFRKIDARRQGKNKYILLPLKKMERRRYIDVQAVTQVGSERQRLGTQVLKLLLEVVTATTFVMLDRLFYEALDVVRHHAEVQYTQEGTHDLDIEVEGTGMVAGVVRQVLGRLHSRGRIKRTLSNKACLPQPRSMQRLYYLLIYGGYLWILLLLYFDAYTLRLRRLICSYFYPKREKQRVLHLYNDILKKRMRMNKTLRKKAIQAVRTFYLSGETLLSLRLKFPKFLGWLGLFPCARKQCLICGETQPRKMKSDEPWNKCDMPKCPFVYCPECWRDAGQRCLACEPGESPSSDADSSDDNNFY